MKSDIKVWKDKADFAATFFVGSFSITYAFPIKELANGASLARMMTFRIRETLSANGTLIDEKELRAVAKQATVELRQIIEPHFGMQGIGSNG